MKKLLFIISALIIFLSPHLNAQDDPFDPAARAFKASDARQLAALFHTSVEISLAGKESSYSQSQAEMVMRDFFRKTPADSFTILQKGTTNSNTQFAIGEYKSAGKIFQVYIRLQAVDSKYRIHQLKFEEKP